MKAHSLKLIPDLIAARADVPAELAAIYTSLMAKDPAERLASATLLAERLAPFCRKAVTDSQVPAAATVPNASSPSSSPLTVMDIATSTEGVRRPPRQGWHKAIAAAGGAAALVFMSVIIITITNKDGTKTTIEVPGDVKVEITSRVDNPVRPSESNGAGERTDKIVYPTESGWYGWPGDAPAPAIAPLDAAQVK